MTEMMERSDFLLAIPSYILERGKPVVVLEESELLEQ